MWKRDKDDFAHEMGKLKRLKNQLGLMKLDYLAEYQVRGRLYGRHGDKARHGEVAGVPGIRALKQRRQRAT